MTDLAFQNAPGDMTASEISRVVRVSDASYNMTMVFEA